MSTKEERELRIRLNAARLRRSDYRYLEILMVLASVGCALLVLLLPAAAFDARHIFLLGIAGSLLSAAFFNAYGNVILQPLVEQSQHDLNEYIDYS